MGNHDEKSESEIKMNAKIEDLIERVKALENILESRFAPATAGHPNDGGWFD